MGKLVGAVVMLIVILGIIKIGQAANKSQANSNRAASGWSQIHQGMTESEVLSALGSPSSKTSSNVGGTKVDDWTYGGLGSGHMYDVTFESGTVFSYSKF
jgi:hypothetical protein